MTDNPQMDRMVKRFQEFEIQVLGLQI